MSPVIVRRDAPSGVQVRDCISLEQDSSRTTHDLVLQAFDRCRRVLAVRVSGRTGLFVGYDVLDLRLVTLERATEIVITAVLKQDQGTRHSVEYTAKIITPSSDTTAGELLVARASGWTLTPSSMSPGDSAPTRSRAPARGVAS